MSDASTHDLKTFEEILAEHAPYALDSWKRRDTTDIYFNSNRTVWIQGQRYYKIAEISPDELYRVISALGTGIGLRPNAKRLVPGGLLCDGTRVQISVFPVTLGDPRGGSVSCRKGAPADTQLDGLSQLSQPEVAFLKQCAEFRGSVGVVGGMGGGKTTILRAFCNAHKPYENDRRIVAIDDSGELRCLLENFELLRTTDLFDPDTYQVLNMAQVAPVGLRTGSDVFMFGEIREPAVAAEFVKGLNTGHPGSSGTWHADGIEDGLHKILELCAQANFPITMRRLAQLLDAMIFAWKETSRINHRPVTVRRAVVARIEVDQSGRVSVSAVDAGKAHYIPRKRPTRLRTAASRPDPPAPQSANSEPAA